MVQLLQPKCPEHFLELLQYMRYPFATDVVEAHATECIRTWLMLIFDIHSNNELNTSKMFQPCKSSPVKLVTDEDLHG